MEDIDSLNIRWGEHIRKNIEEWGEEMQDKLQDKFIEMIKKSFEKNNVDLTLEDYELSLEVLKHYVNNFLGES